MSWCLYSSDQDHFSDGGISCGLHFEVEWCRFAYSQVNMHMQLHFGFQRAQCIYYVIFRYLVINNNGSYVSAKLDMRTGSHLYFILFLPIYPPPLFSTSI